LFATNATMISVANSIGSDVATNAPGVRLRGTSLRASCGYVESVTPGRDRKSL
jgi:hypothetical protein